MKPTRAVLAGVLTAGVLSACGGSSMPPSAAPRDERESQDNDGAPASYQQPGTSESGVQQQQYPQYPSGGSPSGGYAQPPPEPLGPNLQTLDEAESAFTTAAAQLSSAGDDCTTACKALASMQRARDRICELNGPEDPDGRCKDAQERLESAEKRVHGRCACTP